MSNLETLKKYQEWLGGDKSMKELGLTYENVSLAIGEAIKIWGQSIVAASKAKPTATDLLKQCQQVQAERGKDYDSKGTNERSFKQAAEAFNALTGEALTGSDVCLMMVCLKAVRQYSDRNRVHDDSVLDLVSYASLWGEELYDESI